MKKYRDCQHQTRKSDKGTFQPQPLRDSVKLSLQHHFTLISGEQDTCICQSQKDDSRIKIRTDFNKCVAKSFKQINRITRLWASYSERSGMWLKSQNKSLTYKQFSCIFHSVEAWKEVLLAFLTLIKYLSIHGNDRKKQSEMLVWMRKENLPWGGSSEVVLCFCREGSLAGRNYSSLQQTVCIYS